MRGDPDEAGILIELIIPRVSPDGSAAQFRVGAVAGHSMLSMYKGNHHREHMFVLRGRFVAAQSRVELRHRDADGGLVLALRAKNVRGERGDHAWEVGYAHPLSAYQTFCVLLALHALAEE